MQRIIECLSRRCDHVKKRYPTWISYWRSYIRKISKCWRETCEWTGPFRARNWSMVVLVILTEWSSPLAGGFRGAHTETQVVFVVVRSQRPSHTPPPPHRKLTFFLYLSVSFVFLPPPPPSNNLPVVSVRFFVIHYLVRFSVHLPCTFWSSSFGDIRSNEVTRAKWTSMGLHFPFQPTGAIQIQSCRWNRAVQSTSSRWPMTLLFLHKSLSLSLSLLNTTDHQLRFLSHKRNSLAIPVAIPIHPLWNVVISNTQS